MLYDFTQKHPFRLTKLDDPRFEYREKDAEDPIFFIENFCRHLKGPLSRELFKLAEWQKALLRELFGWYYKGTNRLQYRESYIQLPRKQGKSLLISALGLYKFLKDRKQGSEVVVVASTEKQASICFEMAKSSVLQDKRLNSRIKTARKWLEMLEDGIPSVFKMLPADPDPLHGLNISFAIIDELHTHPSGELYDVIKTSQGVRENPMLISITTPGSDKTSFCYEMYEYSKRLLDKADENERFLPVIFELSNPEDWKNKDSWKEAQPNLGVTVFPEALEAEFKAAEAMPSKENTFKQLQLGLWVDQTTPWLPVDLWDEAADESIDFSSLKDKPCYVGLDLSSNDDLTAIAAVWPKMYDSDNYTYVKIWSFIPEGSIWETSKAIEFSYKNWVKSGHLQTNKGEIINYQEIKKFLLDLCSKYNVKEIACDPWNSRQLMSDLQDNHNLTVVDTRQHASSQHPAIQHFERLLLDKTIKHDGNPISRWQFTNIDIKIDDEGKVKFLKQNRRSKIDAMAALVNAFTRVVVNVRESKDLIKEWNGFLHN